MDALSNILDSFRLSGSVFSKAELTAPWAVSTRGSTDSGLFHAIVEGHCWLEVADTRLELHAGDVVLLPHGSPHVLCTEIGLPQMRLSRLPIGRTEAGVDVLEAGGGGARTSIVCGAVRFDRGALHPLLSDLPDVVAVVEANTEASATVRPAVQIMASEMNRSSDGAGSVITRLADVLVLCAVREHISRSDVGQGWTAGLGDPRIAKVLGRIHHAPEKSWTADRLARVAGMSRSAFFARFVGLIGEPPLKYLTRWRMHVASRALQAGGDGLADIAEQVGYASEASFSRAFKQFTGSSPGAWRRDVIAAGA